MIIVYQDGAEFYNADTGEVIFKNPEKVKDFDLDGAMKARNNFIEFAAENNISFIFVESIV